MQRVSFCVWLHEHVLGAGGRMPFHLSADSLGYSLTLHFYFVCSFRMNTWATSSFDLEFLTECVGMSGLACRWKQEDNLEEVILSTSMWVEDQIQVLGSSLQDSMQKPFPASSLQNPTTAASPPLHLFTGTCLSER